MGIYVKSAGAWDQVGVDPMALQWATVTGGTVTVVANSDGSVDEVHTFTASSTLNVVKAGLADVLLVGGGGGGDNNGGGWAAGGGGDVEHGYFSLTSGTHAVTVGTGGAYGATTGVTGLTSNLAGVAYAYPGGGGHIVGHVGPGGGGNNPNTGAAGAAGNGGGATSGAGYVSTISGVSVEYGKGGATNGTTTPSGYGTGGTNNSGLGAGTAGIVIVRVRVSPANPLPVTQDGWATVTGGTVTTYMKPDGSQMEVHTFTANGTLTVDTAGYADVLLVGGGSGYLTVSGFAANGGGGDIISGVRPLPSGTLAVVVGQGGASTTAFATSLGTPSSVGSGLATAVGGYNTGAGGTVAARGTGWSSSISGSAQVYGAGNVASPRSSFGEGGNVGNGTAGIVIVAVQTIPPTVSGVVASGGTESTYVGNGTNGVLGQSYKVHSFLANGTLTVTQGGVCDVLVVGGGGGAGNSYGCPGGGGGVIARAVSLTTLGAIPVTVGVGGTAPNASAAGGNGGQSSFEGIIALGGGGGEGGGAYPAQTAWIASAGGSYANSQVYSGVQGNNATAAVSRVPAQIPPSGGAGGQGNATARTRGAGVFSSISGASTEYGSGGPGMLSGVIPPACASTVGRGGTPENNPGGAGIVIVRYPVAT